MPGQSDKRFPGAGPCMWCVSTLKWIPVGFIVLIVGWSYYAYVLQLCIYTISSPVEKVIYILLYHILLVVFLWSYWQAVSTRIGLVPQQFRFPPSEIEKMKRTESEHERLLIARRFAMNLSVSNFTDNGAVRICNICHHIKPDRAHHCSMCGHCVLKMDHHCAWLNNCVGFTNYKFFVLFLGYALIYCLFITFTTLKYFISFWQGELENAGRSHILFLFFVSLMFALCLLSLFVYHVYLVLYNRTTLESFRAPVFRGGPDKHGFSLGMYNNFQEVFGDDKRLWFLPVFTSCGDGLVFPVRSIHQRNLYNSLDNAQNSLGDGVTFPQRCFDEESDTLLGGNQQWVDVEAGYAEPGLLATRPLSE